MLESTASIQAGVIFGAGAGVIFGASTGVSEHFVGIRAPTLAAAPLITLHHEHLIIYTANTELDSIALSLLRNMFGGKMRNVFCLDVKYSWSHKEYR